MSDDQDQLSFDLGTAPNGGPDEVDRNAPAKSATDPPAAPAADLPAAAATPPGEQAPPDEPPPPTPEQAAAIDARDRDVFLEAGAGTGKTRVLVGRYCDAVDLDGIEPERILAFTFTERAAGEMRRRLRAELTRRATVADHAGDIERRERLLSASRLGGGASISTIHGFCRRLLASYPAAAGLDPRFRVLGADESSRLLRAAFDSALGSLARDDDGVAFLAAGYKVPRLARLTVSAFHQLRSQGIEPPHLPEVTEFAREGAEEGATPPAEVAALRDGYAALGRLIAALSSTYAELKRGRSAIDFDDLQLIALRLLRRNPAIAVAQGRRFDHVLVDEFQDTDAVQLALVHELCRHGARLFTVGDEAQSIYGFRGADLEGFRRERLRAEHGDDGPGGHEALALTGSFRSSPAVVAAVNAIGEALVDDYRPLRVGKPAATEAPADGGTGPAVEILIAENAGWGDEEAGTTIETAVAGSPPHRIAEARVLAARLRQLADEGVDPGSMVVLLRAFTHVEAYEEALALAGLDPYVVSGRGYWSSQQVSDAIRLLSCVANPLDDESLLGALASPACAVAPDTLWMLRRASKSHLWPALAKLNSGAPDEPEEAAAETEQDAERRRWAERIAPDERERLRQFHDRLVELRERASLLPLDVLVERTMEAFGYDIAALQMDDGVRRTANLLKLVRMAGEFDRDEGRDLRAFLRSAADRAASTDRDAEAAMVAEDHSGVRIMTIHAAKGLEFDCVAVADAGRKLGASQAPPDLRVSRAEPEGTGARVALRLARPGAETLSLAGSRDVSDAAADAEAEESGRLAYVAASRARERLLICGMLDPKWERKSQPKELRKRTVLGCILDRLGIENLSESHQRAILPPPEPRPGLEETYEQTEVAIEIVKPSPERAAELSRDHREATAPMPVTGGKPPMLTETERGAAAARHLSYAALTAYQRCGYRFLVEKILRLGTDPGADAPSEEGEPDAEATPAKEWDEEPATAPASGAEPNGTAVGFGRAVHKLLEQAAASDWQPPSDERIVAALASEGVGAASLGPANAMTSGWLGSELLAELRRSGARIRTEVPFRLRLGEETVIRGNIDLLATGPDLVPTIVDYKTDRIGPGGPEMSAAYEIQRALYCAAVAEATGADRVRCVHFFLQAPEQPQVAELDRVGIDAALLTAERLAERIRLGDFRPTDEPHAALCHDCPARHRLCWHGPEMTMRSSPQSAAADGPND